MSDVDQNKVKSNVVKIELRKEHLLPILAVGLFIISYAVAAHTVDNCNYILHPKDPCSTIWNAWRVLMLIVSFAGGVVLSIATFVCFFVELE